MLSLCQNREGGFGPSSSIYAPIPTTCFVDTIIIPLPIILYLAVLPALFFLSRYHHVSSSSLNPSPVRLRHRSRSCLRSTLSTTYYLLLLANTLMVTLEITRLGLIARSPALLPLQYLAILLGFVLHLTSGLRGRCSARLWVGANALLWVGLLVVSIVKVVGLTNGIARMGDAGRVKGTKYPISDQVIDVGVMAGVYALVGVLEVVLGVWTGEKEVEREATGSMEEGIVGTGEGKGT